MNGGPKSLVAMEMASGTSQLVLVSKISIVICINLKIGNSLYFQEGDHVNCHVTAPGAIIALGLMYLKTNDR